MECKTVENVCNELMFHFPPFCYRFNFDKEEQKKTFNCVCASVRMHNGNAQRTGETWPAVKTVLFFFNRWKTEMTFSLQVQCLALCVYFLFYTLEIRRGADEQNEHRK